ncbi:MAG: MlaD family protein [Thermovirgaceae bacterium]
MNREMRVGIAVLLALVFAGTLVFISGGSKLRREGYTLEVKFNDAMGLVKGAPVLVSGIEAGKVSGMRLLERGVLVELEIREGTCIPVDSRFSIDMGGLLGEPRVTVKRGTSSVNLEPGDRTTGEIPPSFDEIMAKAGQSLEEINVTFENVNNFLSDLSKVTSKVETFLNDTGEYVRNASLSIQSLANRIEDVVDENKAALSETVIKLRNLSARLDDMAGRFEEEGPSGKDVKLAVQRVAMAAQEVQSMAESTRRFLEGENGGSAPFTMNDVGELFEKTDRIMSFLDDIDITSEVALHGISSGYSRRDVVLDANFLFQRRSSPYSFLLAAQDIGDDHGATAAVGYSTDFARFWGGAVHGYAGMGMAFNDDFSQGPFSLSAQWWDESSGSWSAESRFRLGDGWGAFYKYQDREPEERHSIGVFYRF